MQVPARLKNVLKASLILSDEQVEAWAAAATQRLEAATRQHDFTPHTSLEGGISNWVVAGKHNRRPAIMKLAGPYGGLSTEAAALREFAPATPDVLLYDEALEVLILERITPGSSVADYRAREGFDLSVTALRKLHSRIHPSIQGARTVQDWSSRLDIDLHNSKHAVFSAPEIRLLKDSILSIVQDSATLEPTLNHGDLYSGNILIGETGPVVIDPRPVYGPAYLDVSYLLREPLLGKDPRPPVDYKLPLLASEFGLNRGMLLKWAFVNCSLSALGLADMPNTGPALASMAKHLATRI